MSKQSLFAFAFVAALSTVSLVGCSGPALSVPETTEPSAVEPVEEDELAEGVIVEPGFASCEFNNDLDDSAWDGSGSYSGGKLDTVEVQETPESYDVTFTGDFIDPDTLLSETASFTPMVFLHSEDPSESIELIADYYGGELVRASAFLSQSQETQTQATATMEPGVFTVSFPKLAPESIGFEPTRWSTRVWLSDAVDSHDTAAEAGRTQSLFLYCGDNSVMPWQPLGSE